MKTLKPWEAALEELVMRTVLSNLFTVPALCSGCCGIPSGGCWFHTDPPYGIRHLILSPPAARGSCLLMGSQWAPAQELPRAEGILNSSPHQSSSNARTQRLGLPQPFASFWDFSERFSQLQCSLPEEFAGPLLQPHWISHSPWSAFSGLDQ